MKQFITTLLLLLVASPVSATHIRGQTIFVSTNAIRVNEGRATLSVSPVLVRAAQAKAEDMVKRKYFAHRSPQGKNMWDFVRGGNYVVLGENLAQGFSTAEELSQAWMESTLHRKNILDVEYQETGIGIAQGRDGKQIVVQLFGSKK